MGIRNISERLLVACALLQLAVSATTAADGSQHKTMVRTFAAEVKSVETLTNFKGRCKPLDRVDPCWVVALRTSEGAVELYAVHSPARTFGASGQDLAGRTFKVVEKTEYANGKPLRVSLEVHAEQMPPDR
jgi:hypothetical protein